MGGKKQARSVDLAATLKARYKVYLKMEGAKAKANLEQVILACTHRLGQQSKAGRAKAKKGGYKWRVGNRSRGKVLKRVHAPASEKL
jgi:hypothetical protein